MVSDPLPSGAVNAAEVIDRIQAHRYTPDEISAYVISFARQIKDGNDSAYEDMADFIKALPQTWRL